MKKRLIITLMLLVILILVSFTIFIFANKNILNKSNEITMIIKEGTLTRNSATVSIKDNNSDNVYGYYYRIIADRIDTESWILLAISPGKAKKPLEFDINWSKSYGELKNGIYRIVKNVSTSEGERELYAEFTIE